MLLFFVKESSEWVVWGSDYTGFRDAEKKLDAGDLEISKKGDAHHYSP